VSDGIATGSIQVPGAGQPIILLVDHQTIGGYAKIAAVISADLPAAGRLLPGAVIGFEAVSVEAAEEARLSHERAIERLLASFVVARDAAAVDETALYAANLVSGVVSADEDGAFP
jgi:allophanate hydrolase subunit 2